MSASTCRPRNPSGCARARAGQRTAIARSALPTLDLSRAIDMGPYYITDLVNLLGPVEVATHVTGTLDFVSGVVVSVTMSFDVPKHRHAPIEIYGEEASLDVPDPNYFGGEIELAEPRKEWRVVPTEHGYADGNYRIIGVADMAHAIHGDRPHRTSGALAFHVLEVMEAFQRS
jgi:predicted dehydrogenase